MEFRINGSAGGDLRASQLAADHATQLSRPTLDVVFNGIELADPA